MCVCNVWTNVNTGACTLCVEARCPYSLETELPVESGSRFVTGKAQ